MINYWCAFGGQKHTNGKSFIHSAGEGRFDKGFIVHNRIIETETAGKVIGGEAVSFKYPACDIAS